VTSTACDPGVLDQCCAGACTDLSGCYTEVEGCTDVCGAQSMTVGQTCAGCGPANAEGICTGGTTHQCNTSSHTLCAEQACGGVTYYCTNDGATWAWRTALPCDDGDPCTYSEACFGGDCLATTYSCESDTCMNRVCDGEGGCIETPIPDVDCGITACPSDTCSGGDWQDYGTSCTNTCSDLGACETCTCTATPTDCTVGAGNECCATACSPSGGCYTASGSCGGTDTCADLYTKVVGSVCTGCGANGGSGTCEGGGTFVCSNGSHTACQNVNCGGTTYFCTNVGSAWQWRTTAGCDDLDACTYGDTCSGSVCSGLGITCTDTQCLLSDCNGTSACAQTPLSSSTTCGTTACPSDSCGVAVWYNYPVSCTSYCSGDGACNTCTCTATSTTCAVGSTNVCCSATCDPGSGCATTAGSCAGADACADANTLYYAKTCAGCGLNGANGACGGGATAVCNETTHTLCQKVTCGGSVYRCTNLVGIWQWRLGTGCDDSNACSYGDACNVSDVCDGTDITCVDSLCVDRDCNGTSNCTVTTPSGNACDDGLPCTYSTTCNGAGSCTGGSTATCTSTTCVTRACDGDSTCAETYPSGNSCDDSLPCTYGTTCSGGSCAGGTTVNCDASDTYCMDYWCDGDSSCASTPRNVGLGCDDGNPLTTGDVCLSSGICQGTVVAPCGDGDIDSGENCDDGNPPAGGDGCDASCHVEMYWVCDGAPSLCHRVRILFAPADTDDATYRANIAAITGGAVDYYYAGSGTPTIGQMQAYDCVYTFPNYAYYDTTGMGNTLASYVDWGGTVVLAVFSTYWTGNYLGGTIMTAGYSPVYSGGGNNHFYSYYYAGGGTTLIHYAVSSYECYFRDYLTLQGSGIMDGYYADGEIAHAYRPDYKVIYSNGAGTAGFACTGDWPRLVANSCSAAYYLGY
jgi:hypothetical protein